MTPLPCQLCKQDVEPIKMTNGAVTICHGLTCKFVAEFLPVDDWNTLQAALIELQREAFEAGHSVAVHNEMGSGKIDFSSPRNKPTLWGKEHGDDEYDGIDAFGYYLAERSEK